jgi:hypothetical protein
MYKLSEISPEDYALYVGLLTQIEHDELIGQWYMPDSYFNAIQDAWDNWVISVEEIAQCVNPDFMWVQNLPLIDYNPKPSPPLP